MNRSYSKKRHIEESNQRLEQQYLEEQGFLNKIKAGVQGAKANIQARAKNMFGSEKIRQNPKLQGLAAKLKTRSEYLEKELGKELGYLKTEVLQYQQELNNLKSKNPDYASEVDQILNQINTYVQSIDNMTAQTRSLQQFNFQYTTQTPNNQPQTQQPNTNQNQQGNANVTQ